MVKAIGYYHWAVETGILPFTSLILLLHNINLAKLRHIRSIIIVSNLTSFEIGILAAVILSAARTSKTLRAVDYFLHRSRIVGFKFFCFHNMLYLGCMSLFDNLLALSLPYGELASYI